MTDIPHENTAMPGGPVGKRVANPWVREAGAMLTLGWPLILTMLMQIATTTTDVAMMGQLGPQALAAGTLGANLYFPAFLIGIGLASATAPMMAQARGARRHWVRDVRRTFRQGLWACALLCLPLWAVLWNAEALLLAMGQDPVLAAMAHLYVMPLMWGLLPGLWFTVLRCFVSVLERPRSALWVAIAAVLLNALLDWMLMFGNWGAPDLGLAGAGIASSLVSAFSFLALAGLVFFDRQYRRFHLFGRFWHADWSRFAEVWRIGLPIAATMALEVTVFNASAFIMGLFGAAPLAAHAIALQVASITLMVPLGLAQATTVRVGLFAGARDPDGVRRAGWTGIGLATGFMAMSACVMLTLPGLLVAPFLNLSAPGADEVVALAAVFLAFAGIFQIADGIQVAAVGALRGLKDTRVPMILAAIGYWGIGMPMALGLAFWADMGGRGLWAGLAIGLAVVAVLLALRFARATRRIA